ncbi:hypothetical protein EDB86DRAFT_827540 [Lactarius hatsudake]|nr:hypothetical protein EDB86DRAFT_827540 [Lactarius hatsudake]
MTFRTLAPNILCMYGEILCHASERLSTSMHRASCSRPRNPILGVSTKVCNPFDMSRSPTPSAIPYTFPTATPSRTPSYNFQVIFGAALNAYKKQTKQDLATHPLSAQLQACNSPSAILNVLHDQVDQFNRSRSGDEGLNKWLNPTVNVLYAFSEVLGEGMGLVFSPAKLVFAGVGVLLLVSDLVSPMRPSVISILRQLRT